MVQHTGPGEYSGAYRLSRTCSGARKGIGARGQKQPENVPLLDPLLLALRLPRGPFRCRLIQQFCQCSAGSPRLIAKSSHAQVVTRERSSAVIYQA